MRYEGNIFRPPSEAYSLIAQVTIGCSHNGCTFCEMYKDKQFRVRDEDEVMRDFEEARRDYRYIRRVFLADGDALVLSTEKLIRILDKISSLFPECERTAIYGSPRDVLAKTPEELAELRKHGIGIIYIGAESGSDKVLTAINKGASRAEIAAAIRRIEDCGIAASVTFISGIGGIDDSEEHAIACGTMITETSPSYVGLLTLRIYPGTPLYEDARAGRFHQLAPADTLKEMLVLLEHAAPQKICVFRSNHASNYVAVNGTLPRDKDAMTAALRNIIQSNVPFREQLFRPL
ncbi:MAG: radical SAM protein [Treponemataceae bacterium]|nr:MAG: radical SAM protein [Treponemataceae bacterium]